MRKFIAVLLIAVACGVISIAGGTKLLGPGLAAYADVDAATMLYEDAVDLKNEGKLDEAIEAYANAIRTNRSVLAQDDHGLIEDLLNDSLARLEQSPNDVKLLETLGFVYAVCYSDNANAIKYYQKVYDLVEDETVKERTQSLIARLEATAQVIESYQEEVVSQMRQEKLETWSEMERAERFGAEVAQAQDQSRQLSDLYREKEGLNARLPQLEQELIQLNEDYDRANRLWHTLNDSLYERRRRRLKDDIADKEIEVKQAKDKMAGINSQVASLEQALNERELAAEESPFRSYQSYDETPAPETVQQAPYSQETAEEETQPLPQADNPDFPEDDPERASEMQRLIDSL